MAVELGYTVLVQLPRYPNLRPAIALTCAALALALPSAAQLPEAAALQAKARADYATARPEFARLLSESTAGSARDPAAAAQAEYLAMMMLLLMGEGGDETSMAAVEAARRTPFASLHPALRGRLGSLLLTARRYHGGQLAELGVELGTIDSLWLCGPFDNERGAGYGTSHEPETRFYPDASYDGKLHAISWRHLPVQPAGGHLDLGGAVRPDQQVMAYLATAVIAEQAGEAALLLGSTGAVRVFLNGVELFARDVEREVFDDQDAVALPLQAGSNLLVVKACQQETPEFGVRLRLCRCDGGQLAGVRCSDAAADLVLANDQQARALPANVTVDDNARTFYTRAAADGDATAAMRLCALLTHGHVDGDRDARPARLAEQAMAGLPDCAEAAFLRFWARPRIVNSAADRDENPQRRDLAEVLRRQPDHVEARLLLASQDIYSSNLLDRAEATLREALAIQPLSSIAHSHLAEVMRRRKLGAVGDRVLEAASGFAITSMGYLRNLCYYREQRGELRLSVAAAERLLRQSTRVPDMLMAARLLLRTGRRERGVGVLNEAKARWPMARAPRQMLADLQGAEGDREAALREWTDWLELCPDDDKALLSVAELHARSGDRERQTEVLRAAIDINPNLSVEQRYLDYLTSDQAPFHQPFELDADAVIAADPGPPADAESSQDPLHHLLQQRVIKAFPNGTTSEYLHQITRVLREEGARSLASWRLPYLRGAQRARILSCKVRHPDGSIDYPKLFGPGVRLQALKPGDIVDVRGRIDDLAPTFFGDYFGLEHRFGVDGSPTQRSDLTVIATPGREYRWQAANGAPEPVRQLLDDGSERYDWRMTGLLRDEPEISRPDGKEWQPLVRMTTYRDWDQFAAWWWNLIEKQIDVTKPMQAKVRELCAGAETPAAKLDAIYRFVTTDVRYEAWEFGVHGYKPYNTSVIFERRHGDCKDKALLLCALLREAGIVARPVLIFASERRSKDDLTLPLVHHFNHCIAWLPDQDGIAQRFVDGTANLHPSDTLPEMDQGAEVLVVEPADALLEDVPWTTPVANVDDYEFLVELSADGNAAVTMTRRPLGNAGVDLRYSLVAAPATLREQLERGLQTRFGKSRIRDVMASDGSDLATPATLKVTFDAEALAQQSGDKLMMATGFESRELRQLAASPERTAPLLLAAPRRDHQVLRVSLPPDMRAGELPPPTRLENAFGSYSLDWRREGDGVVVERDLRLTAPRIQPGDYDSFRAFVAAIQDADAAVLVVEQKEVR